MLRVLTADLHIHTCLSPCASLDMTPRKIVAKALELKLAMIAVTDHNSAENTAAVMTVADGTELCVIPGLEITTAEEAHVVALFGDREAAVSMQELVYEHLQPGENVVDLFGMQVVANENDEVEAMNPRLLIGATTLSVNQVVDGIHEREGLAIAAHIDREGYSLVAQLGFIPPDLELDAVEISRRLSLPAARERFPEYEARPFITASDAHDLDGLGLSPTSFRVASPGFDELRLALKGAEGREIVDG